MITSLSAAVLYLAWIIHATRLVAKRARERERGKGGLLASASPLAAGSSDWRTGVVGGRGAVTDVDGCVGYVEEEGGGGRGGGGGGSQI